VPFLAPLIPLLTSIGSLVGTGVGIAGATGAFGGATPPINGAESGPVPTAAQNVAAEVAKRQQEAQLVNRQIPGLQDASGGSLSDQAYQTEGSQVAGIPGTFGQGGFDLDSLNRLMASLGGSSGGPPTNFMSLASGGSIT